MRVDLGEILQLEYDLDSRRCFAFYDGLAVFFVFNEFPGTNRSSVAAPEGWTAVRIEEIVFAFAEDGPYFQSVTQSPAAAVKRQIRPIKNTAFAAVFGLNRKGVVRFFISDFKADCLEYLTHNQKRTFGEGLRAYFFSVLTSSAISALKVYSRPSLTILRLILSPGALPATIRLN